MLDDLVEIPLQRVRKLVNFRARFVVAAHSSQRLLKLVNQFDGHAREIVHEIKRVLDLVCDPCGQLAE